MLRSNQFIGVSNLKCLKAEKLRDLDEPLIVCNHSEPIAALVPYQTYLRWQELLKAQERSHQS